MKPQRLSIRDIDREYGISRGKIDSLIAQGYLVPQYLNGKPRGKRYFRPEDVEALFKQQSSAAPKRDLQEIMDTAYIKAFGVAPKRMRLQ